MFALPQHGILAGSANFCKVHGVQTTNFCNGQHNLSGHPYSLCGMVPSDLASYKVKAALARLSAVISIYGIRLRRPQFVGRNHEWDYNDLSVGEDLEEKGDVVVKHLVQTQRDWELVDLIDVRDTKNSAGCIQGMASKTGLFCALLPAEERCPYMRIGSGWDEMLSHRLTCSAKNS